LIQTAAINAPRFDYNPTTLAPLGLLIEEQRTNLLTYSEQFNNAAWSKDNCSITANTVVAPDGTTTADTLVRSGAPPSRVFQSSTSVGSLTASVYAKAGTQNFAVFQINTALNINAAFITFDLTNGSVGTSTVLLGSLTLTGTATSVGNGWYRCSVAFSSTLDTVVRIGAANAANTRNGDNGGTIYIWGAQLEAGAFPTSYIPTVASQVTRSADVAVMTGANFSDWYNATEGTLYAEYQVTAGTNQRAFTVSDGTLSNVMNILVTNASGNGSSFAVTTAGSLVASVPTNLATQSATLYKVAGAYKTNDVNGARNGTVGTTDTSAAIPTVDRALIGAGGAASQFLNGHIRQIAFYPRRLANSELQAITA
jgi:hypothetical protein